MSSVAVTQSKVVPGLTVIGTPLPEATTFRHWKGSKPVHHFLLTIRTTAPHGDSMPKDGWPPGTVNFHAVCQDDPKKPVHVRGYKQMCDYAGNLAKQGGVRGLRSSLTPIDLDVHEQCWLLIELDPDINWRFSSDYLACTTKEPEPPCKDQPDGPRSGFNVCLRYAYSDGTVVRFPQDANPGANCRFIFFGVVHRDDKKGQAFNLFVEFYQTDDNGKTWKVLPTVLDPDVPNDGGQGFPDPP